MSYDCIIIGAGPGGTAAAKILAQAGKKVALIENMQWGGTCLNRGCIPTKMLLGAVAAGELARAQERVRVLKSDITVDFAALRTRVDRFLKGSSQTLGKTLKEMGIDLIQGKGSLLSANRVLAETADGTQELEAADIILATGSSNSSFPALAPDGDAVLDSTGILELASVPESLLVIGAGAIGLELGHFYSTMGTKVTIIEGASHIAPLEDTDIADELRKILKKAGTVCVEGIFAKSLTTVDGKAKLVLQDGQEFTAEKALVATGRKPNTEGLGIEKAGIATGRAGYITTNDYLEAADHVYAVGDVNGRVLLAHAAEHQARYVAARILGKETKPYVQGPVPSCYYGLEIMHIGESVASLQKQGKTDISVSKVPMTLNPIAQSHAATAGFVKAVWDGDKLCGMAAIGHDVSHLVSVAQMLILTGQTAESVGSIMMAHPTLDEILVAAITAKKVAVN